jgi:hypothetical protein
MTVLDGFLLGLVAGLSPSLIILCFLARKDIGPIERADQNRFKSHQPISPSQSASLPKATTANRMTANGIGGSRVASTVIPIAATTTSIAVADCMSVIATAIPHYTSLRFPPRRRA